MTLRLRIVLVVTFLVMTTTTAVGILGYQTASQEIYKENADSLEAAAVELQASARASLARADLPGASGGNVAPSAVAAVFPERFSPQFTKVLVQVLDRRGAVVLSPPGRDLPVSNIDKDLAVSNTDALSRLSEMKIRGENYLTITAAIPGGGAVQLARSLSERDRVLQVIRTSTFAAVLGAIIAGLVLSWVLGTGAVLRITRLTKTVEELTETGDLQVKLPIGARDEAGRLATAFQRMLTALGSSREQQRRLVQDVGHELRTPLTSLRTNVAVLRQTRDLPDHELDSLLNDVQEEASALSQLVEEVVEIASGRYISDEPEELVLVDAAASAAQHIERRHARSIRVAGDGSTVLAPATGLQRAITNLLENAVKYSAEDSPIEVVCTRGQVEVLDRGIGIREEEAHRVFDRFYRSASNARTPGSGLGLSIVADIVSACGGTVFAKARAGGGSIVGFRLPQQNSSS